MQRIPVFSEKLVEIIISSIKWSYVIGDVRYYHAALMIMIYLHILWIGRLPRDTCGRMREGYTL